METAHLYGDCPVDWIDYVDQDHYIASEIWHEPYWILLINVTYLQYGFYLAWFTMNISNDI